MDVDGWNMGDAEEEEREEPQEQEQDTDIWSEKAIQEMGAGECLRRALQQGYSIALFPCIVPTLTGCPWLALGATGGQQLIIQGQVLFNCSVPACCCPLQVTGCSELALAARLVLHTRLPCHSHSASSRRWPA